MALACLCAIGCEGRPHRSSGSAHEPRTGPALAVIDLGAGIPEKEESRFLAPPSGRRRSFDSLVKILGEIKHDKDVKGLYVRFGAANFGMARAGELGDLLAEARATMPVHCWAETLGNATLLAATKGCSKITLAPAGEVAAVGLGAQIIYMHKLLSDELHIDLDILQVGKFKGAEEPFTRDGPSPEARESLEGVLVDLRTAWLDGIAHGREGHADVREAAEDGPFAPPAAKDRGIIDDVAYDDDAREAAKSAVSAVREVVRFGAGSRTSETDLDEMLRSLVGEDGSTPHVMVLRASGSITMEGGGVLGEEGIAEKSFVRQIKHVTDDETVRAVVLRIDSPGGSALASDLMWHALMKLRDKKPIVVSVGGMAASGGYYLASTGNEIFADPESIVGSIGVVGGKVGLGDALERIGVHVETFPAKKGDDAAKARAGYESPFVAWDEATRGRVLASMQGIYELFLDRVAKGRKTTTDKIRPWAEGRIFSGVTGKDHGLVDSLGGLKAAITRAKELGGLPHDAPVLVFMTAPRLADILYGADGPESAAPKPLLKWLDDVAPEVPAFVDSLVPLAAQEHVACALPFGLIVR